MTYSFNLNASQLIQMSLQMMNIVSLPDAAQSGDYNFALNVLNMMLKDWETDNIHLWKRKQGSLFIQYNQNSYQLGSVSGSDNCSNIYLQTTSTSTAVTTATTIIVTNVSGMNVNDNIGIELDNLTRYWTTISAINPSTLTITLTGSLPSQASSGITIITYTNKINRPLEILRGSLLDLTTQTEIPLEKLTYDQYFNLPIKTVNFRPVNIYYDKVLNNNLPYSGTLYVYGNPESSKYILNFTYLDAIQDIVNTTDVLDFPQEWLLTITTNLAVMLANFGYGKLIEAQSTQQQAAMLKDKLQSFDSDDEYLTLVLQNTNRLIS